MANNDNSFKEDAQKYFDAKKFRTIIVGKDGYKSDDDLSDAITAYAEGGLSTEEREEVLKHLKASKAKKVMLEAITNAANDARRAKLITACWEIDLDCTQEFLFFVDLVCSDDFNVSLEALTVIENIENPIPEKELEQAVKKISAKIKEKPENIDLLVDLLEIIKHRQA